MNLIQQIQDIDVQLSSLSADYGPNHPEILRYTYQKTRAEEALKQRLQSLRNRIQTEYEVAKKKFEDLDNCSESVKLTTIQSQGEEFRPFRNAQADLESERFIYNQLKSKHRQEIITLEVPRNPVEIIDVAEPNRRPGQSRTCS